MAGLPPLRDILEEYQLVEAEDRYRLLIDLGRQLEPMPDALKTDATKVPRLLGLGVGLSDRRGQPAALPRRQQCRDHQGRRRAGAFTVQDKPAAEVADMDIAECLAPFHLAKHLSANRTQGVPNMIALVKRTAERLVAYPSVRPKLVEGPISLRRSGRAPTGSARTVVGVERETSFFRLLQHVIGRLHLLEALCRRLVAGDWRRGGFP